MQDRYVADVGDFGKYGLLRTLVSPCGTFDALRLGVLWYLVPDENHNNDGRHIAYLRTDPDGAFAVCDQSLFEKLRDVARVGRYVRTVERAGVLPCETRFHSAPLQFDRREPAATRRLKREAWFSEAMDVAEHVDVVFVDPDNGLECRIGRHSKKGPKYTYYSDLMSLAADGRSLVVYHHLSRQGTAHDQVKRRAHDVARVIPATHKIAALRFRRGSSRAYFLGVAPQHEQVVAARLATFLLSPWANHFVREALSLPANRDL